MVLVLTVPSAVGLAVFGVPIISVIYEHGRFLAADTLATAEALAMYAVGLTAYSGVRVLVPIFYSMNKAALPIISSILSVVANYALCHIFSAQMGFAGLALATSCSALVNFFVLFALLHFQLPSFSWKSLLPCFWRVCLASAMMGLALWGAMRWFGGYWMSAGFAAHLLLLLIGLSLAIAVYLGCARVIGLNEAQELLSAMSRKLGVRSKV
jgi:putative peptidoglycan lipid II flippase